MIALLLAAVLSTPVDTGVEVVICLGVECPLSRLYANRLNEWQDKYPGVHFRAIDANEHDSPADVAAFSKEFQLQVPFEKQPALAKRLGATRNPEAFVLLDGEVVYRGRIDDRYAPGRPPRGEPSRLDLELAIQDVLSGRSVSVPKTEPAGCFINFGTDVAEASVEYPQVAGIFHQHCAECHRPGQVAPFSLLTYADTSAWADTIREVIQEGRMPPWGAEGGHFSNDRSLTSDEKELVLAWLDGGASEGGPAPAPPTFKEGWQIEPDVVLTMQEPFMVPAEGIIEYQEFAVDPGFSEDTWVQAIEIQPGNRDVVHHVNAFLRPREAEENTLYLSPAGDYYLGVFVPGNSVTSFGPGVGKVIPAGWVVILNVHYIANGSVQQDQTSIGFKTIPTSELTHEAATRVLIEHDFVIEPNSKHTIAKNMVLEDDFMLAAVYPHMHLRGKSMLFDVVYPNGNVETILNVTKYDFGWQFRYELAEHKFLPKGTVLRCLAVYDNTCANKNNPNPNATVRDGDQTNDEMFRGAWDIYRPIKQEQSVNYTRLLLAIAVAGLYLISGRRTSLRTSA